MKITTFGPVGIIIAFMLFLFPTLSGLKYPTFYRIHFDEELAFKHIETQLSFGPRTPGSAAHKSFLVWAQEELEKNNWQVELQNGVMMGHPLTNIIAKKGSGEKVIILSAHYDSRIIADQDPKYPQLLQPVPGANDGASGVAILMELSRVLNVPDDKKIWIIFYDLEDNGNIQGWEWILGSRYFAENMKIRPDKVVNIDMVGDKDLNIFKEWTSNAGSNDEIWKVARDLGYEEYFIPEYAHSIIDDHTPFLKMGVNAVDIIDMDYAYWHTLSDDISNVSAKSLGIIGRTIEGWIEENVLVNFFESITIPQ